MHHRLHEALQCLFQVWQFSVGKMADLSYFWLFLHAHWLNFARVKLLVNDVIIALDDFWF